MSYRCIMCLADTEVYGIIEHYDECPTHDWYSPKNQALIKRYMGRMKERGTPVTLNAFGFVPKQEQEPR